MNTSTLKNLLFGLIAITMVFFGLRYFLKQNLLSPNKNASNTTTITEQSNAQTPITAAFKCANNKSITAVFTDSQVRLSLSDGREITLLQSISASGARYATSNDSVVFWNKGNAASLTENGANSYDACVTDNKKN